MTLEISAYTCIMKYMLCCKCLIKLSLLPATLWIYCAR